MNKQIYVFRHGQTPMNLLGQWQGCGFDVSLNETGIKQANNLAKVLQNKNIETIYMSPLKRAKETAEIVAKTLNVQTIIHQDLREGSFGVAEGKTKQEIMALYPEILEDWLDMEESKINTGFPNGETKAAIRKRFQSALYGILENSPCSTIGIAAHSAAIRFGLGIQTVEHTKVYPFYLKDGLLIRNPDLDVCLFD